MGVWDSLSEAFLLLRLGVCLGLELVFACQWTFYFVMTRSFSITKYRWTKMQGEGQVTCTILPVFVSHYLPHQTASVPIAHPLPWVLFILVYIQGLCCLGELKRVHCVLSQCPHVLPGLSLRSIVAQSLWDVDVTPCKRTKLLDKTK